MAHTLDGLYTLDKLKEDNLIIFEAIMGSHAYGTSLPTSDTDIRGVFVQPLNDILKYGYVEQVSDELNDITYYELRRFIHLASQNNPNIIEILFAPEDVIQFESIAWLPIKAKAKEFLTKTCRFSFGGYAIQQIKKARGYDKKINWEENELVRKSVLEFCYILDGGKTITLNKWLLDYNKKIIDKFTQKDFSLAKIDHAHDIYALYCIPGLKNGGIVSDIQKANNVQLTSIPKGIPVEAYLTFNKDAYSTHCKRYKEYQTWLKERNEDRFKMNKEHGKNYDSKNMMHTFRLLKVAYEIATEGTINVRRPKEELTTLMSIRRGEYEFDKLLEEAEEMMVKMDNAFKESSLPEQIEFDVNEMLLQVRKYIYGLK